MWDVGCEMYDQKPSLGNLTSHISHHHWDLPFDLAQGGESFDFAQAREPGERPVEPFRA
jgi:hypothetical protein